MNILCINMFADSFDTVEPDFLEQLENLAAAVDTTKCAVVIFNGTENTAQVMEKIQMVTASAGLSKISNMAIVQHTSNILYMGSARIDVNTDIEDDEWNAQPVFNLFTQLCSKYEIDNIDILACSMLPVWTATFEAMEVELRNNLGKNINIRASDDDTGNLKSGGDWFQESDNVNIADLYFNTDKLAAYTGVLGASQKVYLYGKNSQMYQPFFKNDANSPEIGVYGNGAGAFTALKDDGTMVIKGTGNHGGTFNNPNWSPYGNSPANIKTIFSGMYTNTALDNNGTLHSWGHAVFSPEDGLSNVKHVFPNSHCTVVLLNTGEVRSYSSAAALIKTAADNISNVKTVYVGYNLFAAHHNDDTVTIWGSPWNLTGQPASIASLTDVKRIFMGESVGVALKNDGTITTFGKPNAPSFTIQNVNSSSDPANLTANNNAGTLLSAVPVHSPIKTIQSTKDAFAVLHEDGTISTWGDSNRGGKFYHSGPTNNLVINYDTSYTGANPFTNIKYIASTEYAFAALHNDGKVTVWGGTPAERYGGRFNNSATPTDASNIKMIYSNHSAFVALKNDKTIIFWGQGSGPTITTNIKTVFPGGYLTFHAIQYDGAYEIWTGAVKTTGTNGISATFNKTQTCTITGTGMVKFNASGAESDDDWVDIANFALSDNNLYYDTAYKNLDCLTLKDVFVTGSKLSSLENSSLVGTDLTDMDLTGINMSGANVSGAIFTGATLTGVTGTLIGVPAALPNGVTIVNNQFVVSGSSTALTAEDAEEASDEAGIPAADQVKFKIEVTSSALSTDVKDTLKSMVSTAFGEAGTLVQKRARMRKRRKAALNQIFANATESVKKITMTFDDLFTDDNPLFAARSSNEIAVYRLGEKIPREDPEDDIYIPLTEDTDVDWETIGAGNEVKISRGSDVDGEERYTLVVTGTAAIEQYESSAAGYFADPQTRAYFIQNDIVTIAGKTVRFGGSHIGGGGGSGGDPYVFPLCSNIPVKLPNRDETYRMFEQGNNYVNAHVSKATAEHQSRMIKFVKKYTDKVDNVITDGYFYDKFFISAEGHKLMFDLENKKIKGNNDTLRFFKITTSNTKFSNQCFNARCYKVRIEWDTNEGHTIATNIMFFANPNIENGISMEMSSMHDSVGMLIRNYRPKLMRLPSLFTEKYNKLHKALAKSKSKYQNKTIEEPGEGWWPRDAVKHASLR